MTHRSTISLLLFVLLVQCALCVAQEKKHTLLVAPYPGSVPGEYPSAKSDHPRVPPESREQTFYSKDPVETVKAHYAKSVASFELVAEEAGEYYGEVIPSMDVRTYLLSHGVELTEAGWSTDIGSGRAGVTLFGKPNSYDVTVVNVLDALKNAYLQKFIGAEGEDGATVAKHLEDPELTKVLAKYEPMKWGHFPLVKGKNMDEMIYDEHYTERAAALTKEQEQLTKKMTDLMTAGEYDEATKVGERMTEISMLATDSKYNWDIAVRCLDEMALNSYPTKIVIDRPLAEWELSK